MKIESDKSLLLIFQIPTETEESENFSIKLDFILNEEKETSGDDCFKAAHVFRR